MTLYTPGSKMTGGSWLGSSLISHLAWIEYCPGAKPLGTNSPNKISTSDIQHTKTHGEGANRDNSERNFTSTSLVKDSEEGSNVEGGTLGTSLGLDDGSVKLSASGGGTVIDGAEFDFLAQPDGVQISLLDQFNKGLDTNSITNQIASQNSQLAKVGDIVAQSRAGTNNANIQDDIQQLVNSLVHNVDASRAQVNTGLGLFSVKSGGSNGDRDLLASKGSKGNNSMDDKKKKNCDIRLGAEKSEKYNGKDSHCVLQKNKSTTNANTVV